VLEGVDHPARDRHQDLNRLGVPRGTGEAIGVHRAHGPPAQADRHQQRLDRRCLPLQPASDDLILLWDHLERTRVVLEVGEQRGVLARTRPAAEPRHVVEADLAPGAHPARPEHQHHGPRGVVGELAQQAVQQLRLGVRRVERPQHAKSDGGRRDRRRLERGAASAAASPEPRQPGGVVAQHDPEDSTWSSGNTSSAGADSASRSAELAAARLSRTPLSWPFSDRWR
jgi:hypothetical protein